MTASARAEIVARYHVEMEARNAGREPAFLFEPEGGWHCRTHGELKFKDAKEQLPASDSLLEFAQVRAEFQRALGNASAPELAVRESCQRNHRRAWITWRCSFTDTLPEQLWHTQSVECRAEHLSVPGHDTQSELLRSLRNRSLRASITLRDKT